MVERRAALAHRIQQAVGAEVLDIGDPAEGWPALGRLQVAGISVPVAMFIGPVGPGGRRTRDAVERRFQNPGSDRPIEHVPGRRSLLVGLWHEDADLNVTRPILVLAEADRRRGLPTRWPVFVSVVALLEAQETGWSTTTSPTGEVIRCFHAELLPIAVQAEGISGNEIDDRRVQDIVEGSGLNHVSDGSAAERARRGAQVIIRDRRFTLAVRESYAGLCAMCGLGLDLTEGAHIYPASAPGSRDVVSNGLSLCPNHHAAFDRHLIHVAPNSRRLTFHPRIHSDRGDAAAHLLLSTNRVLAEPRDPRARPDGAMLVERYEFYREQYEWMLG